MLTHSVIYDKGLTRGYKRAQYGGLEGIYADYFARGFAQGYIEGRSEYITDVENDCENAERL